MGAHGRRDCGCKLESSQSLGWLLAGRADVAARRDAAVVAKGSVAPGLLGIKDCLCDASGASVGRVWQHHNCTRQRQCELVCRQAKVKVTQETAGATSLAVAIPNPDKPATFILECLRPA